MIFIHEQQEFLVSAWQMFSAAKLWDVVVWVWCLIQLCAYFAVMGWAGLKALRLGRSLARAASLRLRGYRAP